MDANERSLKKPALVSLAAMLVLLVGAVIFFKERLFADTSFIAFNIINYQGLSIQEHRYGSFITQMAPYLCRKLNLPLKTIVVGYAISFNVFYLAACIIIYRLRQYGLTILMALYYFLFVSESYFWPTNEIHQAIAWMFLLFGVTSYLGQKHAGALLLLPVCALLSFLTIFTHFVVVIPTIFLWVYMWLDKTQPQFSRRVSILLGSVLLVTIAAKYAIVATSSYDGEHLHGATHFSLQDIIESFTTPVVQMFLYRCLVNYWWSAIIFFTGIIALIKLKQMKPAGWTFASALGYIIIMGLTYKDTPADLSLYHIESEWASMGVVVAAPFVFTCLSRLRPVMACWLLAAIFITRLAYMGAAAPVFTWRVQFQEHVLAQMRKKHIAKLVLYNDDTYLPKYMLGWTAQYESLFSSALDGDKPQLTFGFVNSDLKETIDALSDPKVFYTSFNAVGYNELNRKYFSIDTTHPYQVMTCNELFK
jgi:hypothetical protein